MTADLQGSCILIHGVPKVGKTSVAASFPGPVWYLATESGHRFVKNREGVHIEPITRWEDMRAILDGNKRLDPTPKTVVIDTIAKAYEMCMSYVCAKNKCDYPRGDDHGKTWKAVWREFHNALNKFHLVCSKADVTFIMIAHTRVDDVTLGIETVRRFSINLPGQAHGIVTELPDYIFHYAYGDERSQSVKKQTGSRVLCVGGSERVEAGSRDDLVTVTAISDVPKTDQYNFITEKLYGNPDSE